MVYVYQFLLAMLGGAIGASIYLTIHERPNSSYVDVADAWYGDLRGYIGRENFPEVTFENSPMEVELVIKK